MSFSDAEASRAEGRDAGSRPGPRFGPGRGGGRSAYPEFRRFNFVVKTFGLRKPEGPEGASRADSELQLLNEFEDSYLSLLSKKMRLLEAKQPGRPLEASRGKEDPGTERVEGVLGNIWIAELNFPVDLESFRRILTDAVYALDPSARKLGSHGAGAAPRSNYSRGAIDMDEIEVLSSSDGETNSCSSSNSFSSSRSVPGSNSFATCNSREDALNSSSGEGSCNWQSAEEPGESSDSGAHYTDSVFCLSPTGARLDHERPLDPDVCSDSTSLNSTELLNEVVENLLSEPESTPKAEQPAGNESCLESPARARDLSYMKSERFTTMLTQCPFLGGPKMYDNRVSDHKARLIIERLLQEAEGRREGCRSEPLELEDGRSKGPGGSPISPASGQKEQQEPAQDDLPDQGFTRKRRKRAKRIFTTRSNRRRGQFRKRVFLQKLNFLVDRLTSRYIARKKAEIIHDAFQLSLDEGFNCTPAAGPEWSLDSFLGLNPRGTPGAPHALTPSGTPKGHGRFLAPDAPCITRDLDSSLREPVRIPPFPLEKMSHRETIKKMLQYYW